MVVMDDAARAERVSMLPAHGAKPEYHHGLLGGNLRLDTLQFAVVPTRLEHPDDWPAVRQANARRYDVLFEDPGLLKDDLVQPLRVVTDRQIFSRYVVRVPRCDELRAFLRERSVGCEVYHPLPFHMQECFAHLGHRTGDSPGK
jgi:dTDP-4-amino-4,6-dideoxygalactose transaminase